MLEAVGGLVGWDILLIIEPYEPGLRLVIILLFTVVDQDFLC